MIRFHNIGRRLFTLAVVATLLSACETTGYGVSGNNQDESRAEMLADEGRHADSAGIYIGLATQAAGNERDRLTLLAVGQWLDAGDARRARNAFSSVSVPTSGELLWLWNNDTAAFALWEGNPDRALALLEPQSQQPLSLRHRLRTEALRADAWLQKDDPAKAIGLYKQRESWLSDPASIDRNRRRLWAGLLVSDVNVLRDAAELSQNPETRGWLTLAVLANSTGQQGIGWGNGIISWQQNNNGHPAIGILSDLSLPDEVLLNYPRQIALLLPLT